MEIKWCEDGIAYIEGTENVTFSFADNGGSESVDIILAMLLHDSQ